MKTFYKEVKVQEFKSIELEQSDFEKLSESEVGIALTFASGVKTDDAKTNVFFEVRRIMGGSLAGDILKVIEKTCKNIYYYDKRLELYNDYIELCRKWARINTNGLYVKGSYRNVDMNSVGGEFIEKIYCDFDNKIVKAIINGVELIAK